MIIVPSFVYASTNMSGAIRTDTTWTKDGSPYIVTGSVSVYGNTTTGVTLTIEPGVKVRFNQYQSLSIGSDANKGALIAQGTEAEPIKFTANTATPSRGWWGSIYFTDGTMDATTIMEHCVVEYAGYTGSGWHNIYL